MIKKIIGLHKSSASNRAAINTVIIYGQRFFAAALSLITTPIILNGLGVKDYGLYTLTIGFVGMLAVLNWSLSSSTQRYTAFAIGKKDTLKLNKVFSSALGIHFFYGLLLVLVIGIISHFFVENLLNIPIGKVEDTKTILYVVGLISFVTIMTIPFLGILRAQENFIAISIIGIMESILKLGIAFTIMALTENKLVIYSILLLGISLVSFTIYYFIVVKTYKEVVISYRFFDKVLVKEMFSFLSWSLLGSLSLTARNEGVQVLINLFFGVVRNAAYGIATQISVALAILAQGIIGSLSPQIIKSAGAGDHVKMIFLMRTMSKFATFSVSLVAIPFFFQCPLILKLWLINVPEDTIIYVRLIIIFGQIMLLSAGIQTVFDAIGKVRTYNIWVSFILMLNIPIAYVFFKLGFPSYTIIIVGMALEFVSLNIRLFLLKKHLDFSIKEFYFDTFFRVFLPTIFVSFVIYSFMLLALNSYLEIMITFLITFLLYPIIIYKFSLEGRQKEFFSGMLSKLIKFKK